MQIFNTKILITGSCGSIGSALATRIYQAEPKQLVLLDQDETGIFYIQGILREAECLVGDIMNKKSIDRIFKKYKPDIVFHVAAYKHVPLMEKQKEEAIENNVYGTKNIIDASLKNGVKKFVFISTDKAVNPISTYGKTKRIGELMCLSQRGKTHFVIARFGNVKRTRGSVIEIFENKIKEGKPIEITHPDMDRYFIEMQDALTLIITAAEKGRNRELYVWDMGKPTKIINLAKSIIKKSGKRIKIIYGKPRNGEKMSEELFFENEKPIGKGDILIARLPYQKINLSKLIKNI
jgi:FlaA1/EpsC-like NDP-sugar epimerase